MRRLALVALVAAAGCSDAAQLAPGPADAFYKPIGVAVYGGKATSGTPPAVRSSKLLVASSNSDLRYDDPTGGTVIAVDPTSAAALVGTINIRSFAGELAVADPDVCPIANPERGAVAIVPVRGDDVLYLIRISEQGALSCDGCDTSIGGSSWADPFVVGLACGPGVARAYVGYLRSGAGQVVIAQVDLTKTPGAPGFLQTRGTTTETQNLGLGQPSAFAYDAARERLYFTRTTTGASGTLTWVDLAGDCEFARGTFCRAASWAAPSGLELRGIALSSADVPSRRAYITAREYDAGSSVTAGTRVGDYGGRLLVADLVENLAGRLEPRIVRQVEGLGHNPTNVVVLPPRAGKRDVVATLASDDGVLWIYDDDTGQAVQIGLDATTGAPLVGHTPFGLAADPVPLPGSVARLYVGAFGESFVTAVDVPLDDPSAACVVAAAGGCAGTFGDALRITGGTVGGTP